MSRKISLFLIASLAMFLESRQTTHACTCVSPPPPAKAFAQADAVFMGQIVSFNATSTERLYIARISVLKIWKGDRESATEIYTAESTAECGYPFRAGETYVIYAYKETSGRHSRNICTRTAPAKQATEDLSYLEKLSDKKKIRPVVAARVSFPETSFSLPE